MIPAGWSPKEARRYLEQENLKWPTRLIEVPRLQWPPSNPTPVQVFRSRFHLVQVFDEKDGMKRLSVILCAVKADGNWEDGMSWDELMEIKKQLGYGAWYGVEVYPREVDLVNVGNLRHLWLMLNPLPIGWFKSTTGLI